MPGSLKQILAFLILVFLMTTALLAQLILRYRRVHEEVRTLASSVKVCAQVTEVSKLALRSRWPAIPQLLDTVAPIARGGAVRAV